jgi:hypothetical protein
MKDMGTPEMKAKLEQGPVGSMTLRRPGPCSMGGPMALYFAYCLAVSFVTAYVLRHSLTPEADCLSIARIAGTCAIGFHVMAALPESIWMGHPWSDTAKRVFDGVVYGIVTAAVFCWLWPRP